MTYLAPRQGIFAAIVLVSLILHVLFFVIGAERNITAQNQTVVDRSVAALSQELVAPLAAYDRVSMSVIAEPYADEQMIGYVGIYDSQGGVLVPLGETGDGYQAEQAITSGDQALGKVVVQAKPVSRAGILSGNWVFLLSVIGLHIILWLVYGYVARPTDELKAQIASQVRKNLLNKGILTEHTTLAQTLSAQTHSEQMADEIAADDSDEIDESVLPPSDTQSLNAAYTVQLGFKDPHRLLTTVGHDVKESYFALCDQLFDRAAKAVLELPIFTGIALTNKKTFDESGVAVTLYATETGAKTAAAAALLSKLLVMVNQVVCDKHRQMHLFALPVKAVCSDADLAQAAKSILDARRENELVIFGETGRQEVATYMTLSPLGNPSTVHERDGREIVGVTTMTADRLKLARDKVLLDEDNT
ncbi:hypothetical protein [Moraxella marmotae]|uniref:hypothetical protein n=1 Tax=Moraxella marmotae TaxID=3344520 RepID=UPI0035F311F1